MRRMKHTMRSVINRIRSAAQSAARSAVGLRPVPARAAGFLLLSFVFTVLPPGKSGSVAGRVNWRLEKTSGEKPAPRGAGKWVPVVNELILFGGFKECFDKTKCDH